MSSFEYSRTQNVTVQSLDLFNYQKIEIRIAKKYKKTNPTV